MSPTPLAAAMSRLPSILKRLIGFDTTSHKSNLELISYIEDYLHTFHVETNRHYNDDKTKASLHGIIRPSSSNARKNGGIGLSGHTDVVPTKGQNWSSDPYEMIETRGRFYGRGTTDMKGFIACALALVPDIDPANLTQPIHFLFSYDEEVGCVGVRPMIDAIKDDPSTCPDYVIVGEPTGNLPVTAHKSIWGFETNIHGLEAHSSVHHKAVSAVAIAGEIIHMINKQQAVFKKAQNDERFDPPFSTLHVGQVNGGTARNIVAKQCQMFWELRALPDFDAKQFTDDFNQTMGETLHPAMHAISKDTFIETKLISHVPALSSSNEAIELVANLTGQNAQSAESYGTEAGLFEQGAMPTIVIGPGFVSEAHIPDEFIEISQLEQCISFLQDLMAYASNSSRAS